MIYEEQNRFREIAVYSAYFALRYRELENGGRHPSPEEVADLKEEAARVEYAWIFGG